MSYNNKWFDTSTIICCMIVVLILITGKIILNRDKNQEYYSPSAPSASNDPSSPRAPHDENFIVTKRYVKTAILRPDFPKPTQPLFGGAACTNYNPPPQTIQVICQNVDAVCPMLDPIADYVYPPDSADVCTLNTTDNKWYKIGQKKDDTLIPAARQKIAAVGQGKDCTQSQFMQQQCIPVDAVCPPAPTPADYVAPPDSLQVCTV